MNCRQTGCDEAVALTDDGDERYCKRHLIQNRRKVRSTYAKPSPRRVSILVIQGIGKGAPKALTKLGVRTLTQLLEVGRTRSGRRKLSARAGVSERVVLDWVNRADIMRVPGVGVEYSDLLEAAGVDTAGELGSRNPRNLRDRMEVVNAKDRLVRRLPSEGEVTKWVAQAKSLKPIVDR